MIIVPNFGHLDAGLLEPLMCGAQVRVTLGNSSTDFNLKTHNTQPAIPLQPYFLSLPAYNIHGPWNNNMYQIRRPLGLVFVIPFVGWENCFCSIFRWTLICPSLSQSPGLLVFPATYHPPHTLIVGPHLNLNHGGVSLTKLTCSSDLALVLFQSFFQTQLSPSRSHSFILTAYKFK